MRQCRGGASSESHWCASNQKGLAQPIWDVVIHGMTQLWPQFSHFRDMFSTKTTSNLLECSAARIFNPCHSCSFIVLSAPVLPTSATLFHFTQQLFQVLTTLLTSFSWCHPQPHTLKRKKVRALYLIPSPTTLTSPSSSPVLPFVPIQTVHHALCGTARCPGGIQEETPDLHAGWASRFEVWHWMMAFLPFLPQNIKYVSKNTTGLLL